MTTRTDLPRLGASLGHLGTLIEHNGTHAWDTSHGWQPGPTQPASTGERGGGLHPPDPTPGEAIDHNDEHRRQRRAAAIHQELRTNLTQLDKLTQDTLRLFDIICPPHPAAARNKRTNDLDPITPADAAAAGWCASCWRNDQQMVAIDVHHKSGLRYYRDLCRWCGAFKAEHGIEPPLEILKLRHDGRRLTTQAVEEAVTRAKTTAPSKTKKGKRKARKAA